MKKIVLLILSVSLLGCGTKGPGQSAYLEALEAELPAYFDVKKITLEETESLGSKTEPLYKARFKSELKAKEDTFVSDSPSRTSFLLDKPKVTYLSSKLKKGDTEDVYGVATATKYRDDWRFSFDFDNSPLSYGQPKNFFEGNAFVKGSQEEKEYNQKLEAQKKADKLATLERFFQGERQGYMTGAFLARPTLKFTSASVDDSKVEGQLIFRGGVIKAFSGSFNDDELVFKVDRIVQGDDATGVGTNYTLRISELTPETRKVIGTYKHVDNRTGEISFPL